MRFSPVLAEDIYLHCSSLEGHMGIAPLYAFLNVSPEVHDVVLEPSNLRLAKAYVWQFLLNVFSLKTTPGELVQPCGPLL
jgi:hypothetical protein